MQTLQALATIGRQLWKTGNDWARWSLALTAAWPAIISLVALLGYGPLTATVGLTPVVALAFVMVAWTDPLVIPVLAAVHVGRTGIQWLSTILGTELLLSVYFALVPVYADPGLVPLLLLAAATQLFLRLGIQGAPARSAQAALWLLITVITVAFFLGGWDAFWSMAASATTRLQPGAPAVLP